jgi:AraC-like DNA-binding protein
METPAMSRKTNKWLLAFLNECQVLVGSLSLNQSWDPQQLKALLSSLPPPRNTFESVVGRCVVLEILTRGGQLQSKAGQKRPSRAGTLPAIEFCLAPLRQRRAASDLSHGVEPFIRADAAALRAMSAADDAVLAMNARAFIDGHYKENATDARVARALGVSRLALVRAFKRVYGQSVHDYLSDVRFARAQHLLQSSDLKVSAVAVEVGYKSHKDLYRLIKARTGMTPIRLRRRERRGGPDGPDSGGCAADR